jgi:hypothetical protein
MGPVQVSGDGEQLGRQPRVFPERSRTGDQPEPRFVEEILGDGAPPAQAEEEGKQTRPVEVIDAIERSRISAAQAGYERGVILRSHL